MKRIAVIIGAGPAGLTAALELLRRTDVQPVVLEASQEIGGISRTIRYKGNRMDIGGHRFFSKSDRVMQWWMDLMPPDLMAPDLMAPDLMPPDPKPPDLIPPHAAPIAESAAAADTPVSISYQGQQRVVVVPARVPEEPPLRGLGPLTIETDTEETDALGEENVAKHGHTTTIAAGVPASEDLVMLVRPRKSRIYYLRKFFDYPIKLSGTTISNLGPVRMARIGVSYVVSRVRPIRPEKSLEDFLINRFGRELYLTFFKSYTEKVWGTPCSTISAEWGAQRIKGLSLTTAVKHFVRKTFTRPPASSGSAAGDVAQKGTDTSLIERFLYPKFGPGQLWEHVADQIVARGGELHMGWKVVGIETAPAGEGDPGTGNPNTGDSSTGDSNIRVLAVVAVNDAGEQRRFTGDFFLSTMPMRDLVRAIDGRGTEIPANVREVSEGLEYRDFVTVGVLANRLDVTEPEGGLIRDTWIYIQEPDVLLGRLQIFNNWSPYMVADASKVWIGLEYFCYETDPLWRMPDEELKRFAAGELEKIGILKTAEVLDAHVVRVPKTYPAYFGTYDRFDELRGWTDSIENLFLVGRNGMHKYNNQDHSMLTAMAVVDGIAAGRVDKAALWEINTEQEYHEEKK